MAKLRRKFHWRIAVGGVRGKSSVTRLIAGALREAGVKVMARTTGSRPVIIFPDGEEREILRPGLPTILEGKKFLHLAKQGQVEAIVSELMAIQPECLEAEVRKIFSPQLLLFTNFRLDHREELGRTKEQVAWNLLRAAIKGLTVFLLEEEMLPGIKETLEKKGIKVVVVGQESGLEHLKDYSPKDLRLNYGDDFPENIRLALAISRFLGIKDEVAGAGMKKVRPDFGGLRLWEMASSEGRPSYVVSAFAANEPESSSLVLKRIKEIIPWEGGKIYGLLLFRKDRGDRTQQWLQAIAEGFFAEFDGLFLSGLTPFPVRLNILKRSEGQSLFFRKYSSPKEENPGKKGMEIETILRDKGPCLKILKPKEVMNLTQELTQKETRPWILIGLGNIVGLGSDLINLWERIGRRIHG